MKKIESQTVWAIVNFEAQEAQDTIVQAFWDEGEANNALEEMENANSDQYLYAGDVIHFKLPIHELQTKTQSLAEEIKELKAENERLREALEECTQQLRDEWISVEVDILPPMEEKTLILLENGYIHLGYYEGADYSGRDRWFCDNNDYHYPIKWRKFPTSLTQNKEER